MKNMIFTSRFILAGLAITLAIVPAKAGMTGDNKTTRPASKENHYSLPGVKPAKPIVTNPEAEPDQSQITTYPDGSFMVGNTRVKISGSVIVDVGTGLVGQK